MKKNETLQNEEKNQILAGNSKLNFNFSNEVANFFFFCKSFSKSSVSKKSEVKMESFFDFKKLVFFFSFPFNDSAASRKKSKDEGKVESFRIADPSDPSSNLALGSVL